MPARPVVIAHRGASGYLPEHTLVAKALAAGMGADFLEQDVVATRDGELLVFHDLTLEDTTDVRERFPDRARADGHWYCIDFSLQEIRTLRARERRRPGSEAPRFPDRYPDGHGTFPIATLDEELAFIRGLEHSLGRRLGIYPEIKEPAWHRALGFELGDRVLATLARHGYGEDREHVFVQCFDAAELQRIRPRTTLPLVQLLESSGGRPDATALRNIRRYAEAIGPSLKLVLRSGDGHPGLTPLVEEAHAAGLAVHPWTVRSDELPAGIGRLETLLDLVLGQAGAEGVFTDFPDQVCRYRDEHLAGES